MQAQFNTSEILRTILRVTLIVLFLNARVVLMAQEADTSGNAAAKTTSSSEVKISETPVAIDPVTLVPAQLVKRVTVTFSGEPLKKVFAWIEKESGFKISVDFKSLASSRLIETEPVSESVDDLPLYVLLTRLQMIGIGWYVENDTLTLTSRLDASHHEVTRPYHVGDLLDAGYVPNRLVQTVSVFINQLVPENDPNRVHLIGDVMFIRHFDQVQFEVAGLLTALRNPGRRTFTFDSPQNELLRKGLLQPVTVEYKDTALTVVVEELSRQSKLPIRLVHHGLVTSNIRERVSISLKLSDQPLKMALDMLQPVARVGWYVQDEVIWITADVAVQTVKKAAVYDVRDLCRNAEETSALIAAVTQQSPYKWSRGDANSGYLESPIPGILIARETELALDNLLEWLERYRAALKVSKVRNYGSPVPDAAEVVTGYYRLPRLMAQDLTSVLPRLVQPNSWKSDKTPEAVGEILEIAADTRVGNTAEKDTSKSLVSENSILVIKQSRAVHQQIGKLIRQLNNSTSVDHDATADTTKKPKTSTVNFGSQLTPADAK